MAASLDRYLQSDLDGQDPGGFVVVNVNARMRNPCQVLEDGGNGAYFQSLRAARAACQRWRQEGDNPDIFVYALTGVRAAVSADSGAYDLA